MGYAAQYGGQLELRFSGSGYTPPTGDAVVLRFETTPVVFRIRGATRISAALVNHITLSADYAIQAGTITGFEQPYRTFAIASTSTVYATHPQRALEIWSGSTPTFRAGVRLSVVGGSTLDYKIHDLRPISYGILSGTTLSSQGIAFAATTATIRCKSVVNTRGGYNAMTQMWVYGRSVFAPAYTYTHRITLNIPSGSTLAMEGQRNADTVATIATSSTVSAKSVAISRSATSILSESIVSLSAIPTVRGDYAEISGTTFTPDGVSVHRRAYAIISRSTFTPSRRRVVQSVFAMAPMSTLALRTQAIYRAAFASSGESIVFAKAITATQREYAINTNTQCAFGSGYSVVILPAAPDLLAYARTKTTSAFVRT